MASRRSAVPVLFLILSAASAATLWAMWPAGAARAQSSPDLDGVSFTSAPNGVTFFDARTGDVWFHPYQLTGATGTAHFRVSERGAKLTAVPEKK